MRPAFSCFALLASILALGASVGAGATLAAEPNAPAATDVLLIFDTTASMSAALTSAKDEIESSMAQIDADLPNVRYGVAEVADYPDPIGAAGDVPWKLDQPITDDRAIISSSVGALHATGGGSPPEAYARALWEADTNPAVGWRPEAKHVIMLVGDSYPHDDDLNEGVASSDWIGPSPLSTGVDPGPDETVGTTDDLDWQTVLGQLNAHDIPMMFLFYNGPQAVQPYWQAWAAATGGLMEPGGSGQLPADLVYLVERGAGLPPCLDPNDSPPCAEVPPAQVKAWHAKRGDVQMDQAAADRVPFDVRISGTVSAGGDVFSSTTATLSGGLDSMLQITPSEGPAATYSLSTGRFDVTDGVTSSPATLGLPLAWPANPGDGATSMPFFAVDSHSGYDQAFAHITVDTSILGSLSTSVGEVATWARTHRWLGKAGWPAALAQWLTQHANSVPSAYGAPLQFDPLAASLRPFVIRADQLAPKSPHGSRGARASKTNRSPLAITRRIGRTMPSSKLLVPAQSAPAGVDTAGLRQPLFVRAATKKGLRHGSWRRPRARAAQASAALLGMPLPSQQQPLWLSSRRVRAGQSVTLLASHMRRARDVGVTLVREGYSAEAGLKARRGTAAGTIFIPKALDPGSYWVGVLDFSQLNRGTGPVRIASARIAVSR